MFKFPFSTTVTIHIEASPSEVWDALTNPAIIKQYLMGTDTITDWKVGSEIVFQGSYDGHSYRDTGVITKFDVNKTLQYTYWSSMSDIEDLPENKMLITCSLTEKHGDTELNVLQENVRSEETAKHSEHNWAAVLESLKSIVESPQ
ncbi:MAG: SRPBCC domain-containing protein [Saprospiraceae bacterium]